MFFRRLVSSGGGGAIPSVPVVTSVSHAYVDPVGGGQRLAVGVDSSVGCTGIAAGGTAFTAFAIDDATHVSGVPGAHAAGLVDVVVTNATGVSTTGTGLVRYWSPLQIAGVTKYLDAGKGVTLATGSKVSTWTDQVGADAFTQATALLRPALVASTFGTVPAVRMTETTVLDGVGESAIDGGSFFAVVKTTAATAVVANAFDVPQTILGGSGWSGFGLSGNGSPALKTYDRSEQSYGGGLNDGAARLVGIVSDGAAGLPVLTGYLGATAIGTSTKAGDAVAYYEKIGSYSGADAYAGDVGAIVVCGGAVISAPDLAILNAWAQQRFGTVDTQPAWEPLHDTARLSALYLPGAYAVTGTQGVDAVGTWTDATGRGRDLSNIAANVAPVAHANAYPTFDGSTTGLTVAASFGGSLASVTSGAVLSVAKHDAPLGPKVGEYQNAAICAGTGATPTLSADDSGLRFSGYDGAAYIESTDAGFLAATDHVCAGKWDDLGLYCTLGTSWPAVAPFTDGFPSLDGPNVGADTNVGAGYGADYIWLGAIKVLAFYIDQEDASNAKLAQWHAWALAQGLI